MSGDAADELAHVLSTRQWSGDSSLSALKSMLIRHEGIRLQAYTDTVGKLSLGIGRNIQDVGISKEEALYLLENDIAETRMLLNQNFHWFKELDSVRQDALTDMAFNLGVKKLSEFKNFISALGMHNYVKASQEMLASEWAKQVGARALELSAMMRTGAYREA